jgi:hypothetical protein
MESIEILMDTISGKQLRDPPQSPLKMGKKIINSPPFSRGAGGDL